jgi:hypothetical protein
VSAATVWANCSVHHARTIIAQVDSEGKQVPTDHGKSLPVHDQSPGDSRWGPDAAAAVYSRNRESAGGYVMRFSASIWEDTVPQLDFGSPRNAHGQSRIGKVIMCLNGKI